MSWEKIKKISIKKAIIILFILAILGFIFIFYFAAKQKKISYKTIVVKAGDIVQTVSETGTIKAKEQLDLSFLNTGKIQRLNFAIGDFVKKGQLLAELDYSSLVIAKQEAQANHDVAVENLNKLLAGATSEAKAVAEATVRQAETVLESSKNEMSRIRASMAENIAQAQKTLDDLESDTDTTLTSFEQAVMSAKTSLVNTKTSKQQAIDNYRDSSLVTIDDKISLANTALDAVNRVLTDEDGKDYLSVKNTVYLNLATDNYNSAIKQKTLSINSLTTAKISLSQNAVNASLVNAIYFLDLTIASLNNTFSALDNSVTATDFTQSDIDAHKTTLSTQLVTINTARVALKTAEQNYHDAILDYSTSVKSAEDALVQAQSTYNDAVISARNSLNTAKINSEQQISLAQSKVNASEESLRVAEAKRDQILAAANVHDITLYRAKIRQTQAELDSINNKINNSQINAPMDGLITAVNFEVGEQVISGQAVITLLGKGDYEIEVLISETDIVKVKLQDKVTISLDAYNDENIFYGQVSSIDPAETVIQDVIYYLVKIKFDEYIAEIKSGMTANITITTNQKKNVIVIPSRAIVDQGSKGKIVKLLIDKQVKEQKIITGIRGDNGDIEVLDGLRAGDVLITQTIEK